MNNLFSTIPTKIKLILIGLIIIILILFVLQSSTQETNKEQPPEQQIQVGKQLNQQLEEKLDITKKEATDGGKVIYSLNSENPIRTDQVITQNNKIIFNRTYIPENPTDPNHLLISKMTAKYGNAEKTIQGSKTWGQFVILYVYGSKGLAFIGNPSTDEVYELQTFSPTTVEDYIQKYGDDIDQTPHGGES